MARDVVRQTIQQGEVPSSAGAAVFLLAAAEWWGRHHDGAIARYAPIFHWLDVAEPEAKLCRDLVDRGLKWWHRPLQRTTLRSQYLGSIAVEAGIPTRVLNRDQGPIVTTLRHLVRTLEGLERAGLSTVSPIDPDDRLFSQALTGLPETLRTSVGFVRVLVDLALWVRCVRRALGEQLSAAAIGSGSAIVDVLDKQMPDWRERTPLRMPAAEEGEQGAFAAIVERLLVPPTKGEVKEAGRTILLARGLERHQGTWKAVACLRLPSSLSAALMPALRSLPPQAQRLRVRAADPATGRAFGQRVLAVYERNQEEWHRRSPPAEHWVPLALGDPASFLLETEGAEVAILPEGSAPPLAQGPALLEPADREASGPSACASLRVLPPGVLRTPHSFAMVAWAEGEHPASLPGLAEADRAPGGVVLRWLTSDTALDHADGTGPLGTVRLGALEPSPRLILSPRPPPVMVRATGRVPLSQGMPAAWVAAADDSEPVQLAADQLRWRRPRERQWRRLPANPGPIVMGLSVRGEILATARCDMVPDALSITLHNTGREDGTIWLQGLDAVAARVLQPAAGGHLEQVAAADGLQISWQGEATGVAMLRIQLLSPDQSVVDVEVPAPGHRAGFIDSQDRWLEDGQMLSVGALYGVRVRVPGDGRLWVRLVDPEAPDLQHLHPPPWLFEDTLSLTLLSDELRRMLDSRGSQGVFVELSVSGGRERLRVSWYGGALEMDAARQIRLSPPDCVPGAVATVEAIAVDPRAPQAPVALAVAASGVIDPPPDTTPGPWLVIAQRADGTRLRPRPLLIPPDDEIPSTSAGDTAVQPHVEDEVSRALSDALAIANSIDRHKELAHLVEAMAAQAPDHFLWTQLGRQVHQLIQLGLPRRTFDLPALALQRPRPRVLMCLAAADVAVAESLIATTGHGRPPVETYPFKVWRWGIQARLARAQSTYPTIPPELQRRLALPLWDHCPADRMGLAALLYLAGEGQTLDPPAPAGFDVANSLACPAKLLDQLEDEARQTLLTAATENALWPDWRTLERTAPWPRPMGLEARASAADGPAAAAWLCAQGRIPEGETAEALGRIRALSPASFDKAFAIRLAHIIRLAPP